MLDWQLMYKTTGPGSYNEYWIWTHQVGQVLNMSNARCKWTIINDKNIDYHITSLLHEMVYKNKFF